MRFLILSLLVLQQMLPGAFSEGDVRKPKPVMCKNPKAKEGSSRLQDCFTATCKKVGKRGVWQTCPSPALEKTVLENQRKVDRNHELLKEILENLGQPNCCPTIQTTTWEPASTTVDGPPSDCQCGLAKRRTKIVGGIETEVNEYPWQAGLIWDPYSTTAFYCGGSLISNGWILSAAHCTQGTAASDWHASLGDHDYESSTESNHINMDIALILDHPNYDDDITNFDFTLLKMKNTIDFSLHPHIRPICLPINEENTYNNFPATVTGWGTISSGGPVSNKLLEVNVNVLSNTECKNDYYYDPEEITEQMLCANVDGGGKDACQGDSGGPLVTSGSSNGMDPGQNYELIGVVSWGIGCASSSFPGVYARVTKQLDWIKETTAAGWYTCPRN